MVSWTTVKENIVSYLSQAILGLIGLALLTIALLFVPDTFLQKLQNLPPTLQAKTIIGLLGACFLLLAYIVYSKPKYEFYPDIGIDADFKTLSFICPSCKHKMRIEEKCFHCMSCNKEISMSSRSMLEKIEKWKKT